MTPAEFRKAIGPVGYFTLSFGAIVGSSWLVLLGEWLGMAAPGGAVIGFVAGGVAMVLVALCYAELCSRQPQAGGEVIYVLKAFGPTAAFLVGWFLTLFAIAVCAFEAIALAWLLETLIPTLKAAPLYESFGRAVTANSLIIGFVGTIGIGLLHHYGAQALARFQNGATFFFLCVVALIMVLSLAGGATANLEPLFEPSRGGKWYTGAAWIFATASMQLNGFQAALHAIEERRNGVTLKKVIAAMMFGLLGAVAFYCLIIVSAARAASWQGIAQTELPAAAAFTELPLGRWLGPLTLIVAVVSLAKTWSAVALIGSRLLFAQARLGLLPAIFARLSPRHGSPTAAIVFVSVCSLAGILIGRSAVLAVVGTCSICLAFSYTLCIAALLRARKTDPFPPAFRVPGGTITIMTAGVLSAVMAFTALWEPSTRDQAGIPLEWTLLLIWSTAGVLVWRRSRAVTANTSLEKA